MSKKNRIFAPNLTNNCKMTQPKTIANRLRTRLNKALAKGEQEVIYVDANNHKLAATYHEESPEQPWFINEYIPWKDCYAWTEYCRLIEDEL